MNQFDPYTPEPQPKSSRKWLWIGLGGCLVLFLCLATTAVIGAATYLYFQTEEEATAVSDLQITRDAEATRRAIEANTPVPLETATSAATSTPIPEAPTATITAEPISDLELPVPDQIETAQISNQAYDDLDKLFDTHYPTNDYFEPEQRLGNYDLGPRTVNGPKFELGDVRSFYNGDKQIDATLMAITEHAYFWIEEGVDVDETAVIETATRFEEEYFAAITDLFGEFWTPGIDGDPRFSVLNVSDGTGDELGRFNSTDEFPKSLYSQSNEQEMLYMNLDALDFGSELYFGTLVHELQHLIQWYVDPSEALWVNEGLSQLAEIYVGLETADTYDYLIEPETQLNSWDSDDDKVYAHYAGSYLFMVYLWEQLGDEAIREFSRHPANGMAGVKAIIEGYDPQGRTLEQFIADWAAANYLDDLATGPRYNYNAITFRRPVFEEEILEPGYETTNTLNQYGVHYYDLNEIRGDTTISFAGDTLVPLTDAQPRSGSTMWFAPAVNEMNAQLTGTFDLTNADDATLTYSVWHDLEDDYDYAYVSISDDGGETWAILEPDSLIGEWNGYYGPAYNGRSDINITTENGWLKDTISLAAYAGQTVMIRFEVFTDSDIVGAGFAIDDIAISGIDYQTDSESGPDGWEANGFVQMGWQLPQQWQVQLIVEGPEPTVETLELNDFNQLEWNTNIGKGGGVLVITPMTPFNDKTADYWLKIEQ